MIEEIMSYFGWARIEKVYYLEELLINAEFRELVLEQKFVEQAEFNIKLQRALLNRRKKK